jgi:hypothetical protein
MTLTIDIPEKIVERANELDLPVSTLVSQVLDAAAAEDDRRRPPMINASRAHRIPEFSGPTMSTKAERAEIAEIEKRNAEYSARVMKTPETALQELVEAGICQPDGQLTEHYR